MVSAGEDADVHALKRPKPVVSGWVVRGYLSFPLRKHCGNADKQQLKHVFQCEGQTCIPTNYPSTNYLFWWFGVRVFAERGFDGLAIH